MKCDVQPISDCRMLLLELKVCCTSHKEPFAILSPCMSQRRGRSGPRGWLLECGGAPGCDAKRLWFRPCLLADSGYFFVCRFVRVSAFVCLPLDMKFDAFFVDFSVRGMPRGYRKCTLNLEMTILGSHGAGTGSRDRFLVNLGYILGPILETILHTGGHLWQLVASSWYLFCSDVFDMVSSTSRGRANVAPVQ